MPVVRPPKHPLPLRRHAKTNHLGLPRYPRQARGKLRMRIPELAHMGKVWIEPDADDWFGGLELTDFVTRIRLDAKVGDATKAEVSLILVNVEAEFDSGHTLLTLPVQKRRRWRVRRLFEPRSAWARKYAA